jgi:hypothetical protein
VVQRAELELQGTQSESGRPQGERVPAAVRRQKALGKSRLGLGLGLGIGWNRHLQFVDKGGRQEIGPRTEHLPQLQHSPTIESVEDSWVRVRVREVESDLHHGV